jgi:hypothetical protein
LIEYIRNKFDMEFLFNKLVGKTEEVEIEEVVMMVFCLYLYSTY